MGPVKGDGKAAHRIDSRHGKHRAGEPLRQIWPISLHIGNAERRACGKRAKQSRVGVERAYRAAAPALGAFPPYEPLSVPAKRGGRGQTEPLKRLLRQKTVDLGRLLRFEHGRP